MKTYDHELHFVPDEEVCTDYLAPDCVHNHLDRIWQGVFAKTTLGVSPAGMFSVAVNWWSHWLLSPGKQMRSLQKAVRKSIKATEYALNAALPGPRPEFIQPLPQDQRFRAEQWHHWPFNVVQQSFLLYQQWWHVTVSDVRGVPDRDNRVVAFAVRQWLDMFSPSNCFWLNPEVLQATWQQRGVNLWRGYVNCCDDLLHTFLRKRPDAATEFQVGKRVAITPGTVVFRNSMIELIYYAPQKTEVYREPVLIVSAWIMKYYILDLSPENSLVNYLLPQGHGVFVVSWKNPDAGDSEWSLDDYRTHGVLAAMDAISDICGDVHLHAVGYCLGGTLMTITAAALANAKDARMASLTLFATEIDYSDPGELGLFISESEVAYLEAMMEQQGYLDTGQMIGAFQILHSNDLIWSRSVREYLLGEREPINDLMAWNSDLTRMPYRMHSQYLRQMFLQNALAAGNYRVDGRAVAVANIRVPIFCVSTVTDHVAPWRAVYKIHMLSDTDITFVLTNGGHNAGIVSPPGKPGRRFHIKTTCAVDPYQEPDTWLAASEAHEGSWWPAWQQWLVQNSSPLQIAPPIASQDLAPAPGFYVLQS